MTSINLQAIDGPVLSSETVWDWRANVDMGISIFDNEFDNGIWGLYGFDWSDDEEHSHYYQRNQDAEWLEEVNFDDIADTIRWTWDPRDHDDETEVYSMREDLSELENAIEIAELVSESELDFPELQHRDENDQEIVEENFNDEPVFRSIAYQTYFRFNSPHNRLFDEYGILRRNLSPESDATVGGGPNLLAYIEEYESEHWND